METRKTVKNEFVEVLVYNDNGMMKTHCFPLDFATIQLFVALSDMKDGEKAYIVSFEFTNTGRRHDLTRVFSFTKHEDIIIGANLINNMIENLKTFVF